MSKGDETDGNRPRRRRVALGLVGAALTALVLLLFFGILVGGVLAVFVVPAELVVLAAVAGGRDDPS